MTRSVDVIAAARQHPGMPALIRAMEVCGSPQLLAVALGVGPGKIMGWLTRTYRVPLEFVPMICDAVNDPEVTPMKLRPDFATGWTLLARQLNPQPPRRRKVVETEALEGEPQ